jgi:shikimate dehydrogenase
MTSEGQPAAVQRFAVLGDPINHSLSPVIHNGWMADHALSATYERIRVPAGEFPERVRELTGLGYAGFNVTLPHKMAALALADQVSPLAQTLGAANVLARTADGLGWVAHNTDAEGFAVAVEHFLGAQGQSGQGIGSILVLGAGGAAPAVLVWLAQRTERVTLLNRSPDKAQALAQRFLGHRGHEVTFGGLDRLGEDAAQAGLVINTTSLGHQGGSLMLGPGAGRLLMDLSYAKAAQAVLDPAARDGWQTCDGLVMLVAQAAAAFRIWFGVTPDLEVALARARAALGVTT